MHVISQNALENALTICLIAIMNKNMLVREKSALKINTTKTWFCDWLSIDLSSNIISLQTVLRLWFDGRFLLHTTASDWGNPLRMLV